MDYINISQILKLDKYQSKSLKDFVDLDIFIETITIERDGYRIVFHTADSILYSIYSAAKYIKMECQDLLAYNGMKNNFEKPIKARVEMQNILVKNNSYKRYILT